MKIFSIFNSISGEVGAVPQGTPTTFIRLSGCNCKCVYCDANQTQSGEQFTEMSVGNIIDEIHRKGPLEHILITGGEPLLQWDKIGRMLVHPFFTNRKITVETNGTFPCPLEKYALNGITWVVDYKLDGSGMNHKMSKDIGHWGTYPYEKTWIKLVCSDEHDMEQALSVIQQLRVVHMNFAIGATNLKLLQKIARLVIDSGEDVVINLQIHKFLFPTGEKGDRR